VLLHFQDLYGYSRHKSECRIDEFFYYEGEGEKMKSKLLSTTLLAFAIFISACGPVTTETLTSVDTALIPETGVTGTESVTETATPGTEAAIATQASTETQLPPETPTIAEGPNVTLMVSNMGATPFLVDHQGRSLYVYLNDSQYSSTSSCLDDCAVDWPPLVITGSIAVGEGVDITQSGTLRRVDGSSQVTFNGWPLYYSNQDTIPGSTNGQSYNGVWFLISPAGEAIQR
jgi:predicted lipoprotein with Yx(FWY)xxD motif